MLSFLYWPFLWLIFLILKAFQFGRNLWVKEMLDGLFRGHVARMFEGFGGFRHERLR